MPHEKRNYLCKKCKSRNVIRKGVRNGKIKFLCKSCRSWFQLNRRPDLNNSSLISDHFSGLSFRSLGNKYGINASTAYRRYSSELETKYHCVDITRNYCSKFCGILLVDGKYLSVKGYSRKIPVIYGIDYLTHDIPNYCLSVSENYQVLKKFFTSLRLANYSLQAVISDDNQNVPQACKYVYPNAIWQLCQNHYKQSLRSSLGLYQDKTHLNFMREVEKLFSTKISIEDFKGRSLKIYEYYKNDSLATKVMLDVARRSPELMAYTRLKHVPRTNNLIESFNSHLEGRLKTIKGFESFKHANHWLNQYFIQRRLKPFTDCGGRFKRLNGKSSLSLTLKNNYKQEDILNLIR